MQTMKHTEGLWEVSDGAILSKTINDYGNFIVCDLPRERTEQDEGNLKLMGNAPWYRVLALIATDARAHCGIMEMQGYKDIEQGWRITIFGDKTWHWPGTVDPFGVPVPPPQEMFNEIKQAVENL